MGHISYVAQAIIHLGSNYIDVEDKINCGVFMWFCIAQLKFGHENHSDGKHFFYSTNCGLELAAYFVHF